MIYIRIYLNLWFEKKKFEFTDLFFESLKIFTGNLMDSTERKKKITVELERKKRV